jgi:hypothetical protein
MFVYSFNGIDIGSQGLLLTFKPILLITCLQGMLSLLCLTVNAPVELRIPRTVYVLLSSLGYRLSLLSQLYLSVLGDMAYITSD